MMESSTETIFCNYFQTVDSKSIPSWKEEKKQREKVNVRMQIYSTNKFHCISPDEICVFFVWFTHDEQMTWNCQNI